MKHSYTKLTDKLQHFFKPVLISASLSILSVHASAQFTVTTNQTATQLAQRLVGNGVTFNNATLVCDGSAEGKFTNINTSLVGIDSGIVLTSGNAAGIGNPASFFCSGATTTGGDAQLTAIAGVATYDKCILEFDFVPAGDTVKFDYVFASEEHPGFWCSTVNDPFGFFINGPGITGTQNIALVPGTNIPVTINSVNGSTSPGILCTQIGTGSPFTQYYVNNQSSTTIAFGGMTTMFTALSPVIPCSTYHLKLGVADGGDQSHSSAVFLKQGSLSSTPVSVSSQGGSTNNLNGLTVPHNYCVRGCLAGQFKFNRPVATPLPQTVHYIIGGTAINGTDYITIPDSVTIPANQTQATVTINPLTPPTGTDIVTLYLLNNNVCNGLNNIVDSVKLWIYDSLQAQILTNDTTICTGQTIQLIGYGDTLLSYSWSPTTGLSNPNIKSPFATPTSTITYTLTASLPGSTCPSVHDNVTITLPTAPPNPTSNSPVCAGQTINLFGPSIVGATYYWTGPQGFTSNLQNPSISGVSTLNSGTYTLTMSVNGCQLPSVSVSVFVNNPPNVTAGSNSPLCAGSTLNLTSSVAGATYSWTGPNSFTSTLQNPSITGVTAVNAGLYSLTVTQNGCTSSPATTFVIVNALGTTPIAGSNSPICSGSNLTLTATNIPGATYSWTGPNSFTSNLQNPTINGATTAASGVYSVTATVNGCTSNASTVNVLVKPTPVITSTTYTNPTGCGSNTGTITLNGLAPNTSYTVNFQKNGTPQTQSPMSSGGGAAILTNLGAGSYSNIIVTLNGCSSLPAGPIVLVDPSAPPSPTAGSNSPICAGQPLNLTATTVAGATYAWTGPGTYTSNQQNPTITGTTTANAGVYSVVATVNNCQSQPGTVTVVVNPVPVTPTASSNSPVCSGNNLNLTATTTTTGVNWNWTGPNSFTSTQQNPNIAGATTAATGTYTVTASVGACVSQPTNVNVTVNPTPSIAATYTHPTVCGGNDGTITLSGLNNTTYQLNYSKNSVPVAQTSPAITNGSYVITGLTAGSYTNITMTLNGCPSNIIGPIILTDPNSPATPVASNSSPACEGTDVTLDASTVPGAIYIWSGPNGFADTTQSATVVGIPLAGAGTYSVVANVNGCNSLPATTNVVVDPAPAAPAMTSNSPVCSDNDINLTSSVPGVTYNWTGPNGFTNTTQNPTIAAAQTVNSGWYKLTITAGTGCSSLPDSINVVVNQTPGPPTVITPVEFCQFEQVQLTAQGQNLLWYTSSTGGTGTPTMNANTSTASNTFYYVSQTVNGCEGPREPLEVIVKPQPVPPVVTPAYTYCQFDTTAIALNATGQNILWYDVAVGGTPLGSAPIPATTVPGVFTWYATQTDNSCESDRQPVEVTIYEKPGLPEVQEIKYCVDDVPTSVSAVGQNLLWYTDVIGGTGDPNAPTPGTATVGTTEYYVSQTINGCEGDRALLLVTVNPKVTASIAGDDKTCIGKPVTITFTGSGPTTSNYTWDFDGASSVTGSGAGPYTLIWDDAGDKVVTVTITNLNCSATATFTIDVDPTPLAHFDIQPDACKDEVVKVQVDYDLMHMPGFTWDFGDAQILEGSGYGPYSLKWGNTGQKTISLTLTEINCPSDPYFDTINIHHPVARVENISSNEICSADSVLFTAYAGLDYTYAWSPSTFFSSDPTGMSAWGVVQNTGFVTLKVTDRWGCAATDSVLVETKACCQVYFPNAFSPNGDGKNDVFRLVTKGNHTISRFIIMDRWGKKVFETADPNEAWDGTFNGEPQDIGNYTYYLKYRCAEGKDMMEQKGDIMLVR